MIPAQGASVPDAAHSAVTGRSGRARVGVLPAVARGAAGSDLSERDAAGLVFTGEMYGLQLDQLAVVLGVSGQRAAAVAARWHGQQLAAVARIGPGARWVWLTRAGLARCGLPYSPAPPALSRLAHIRAAAAVRIALESAPAYAAAGGFWRGERRLRARAGGRVGLRVHFPDGEIHWPDDAAVAWAGECWAVEAELTPKTVRRTAAIMRELLGRTGDYGCPAAQAWVPGLPPRHARALYVCAPAARGTVTRARETLGRLGQRIEIRFLPPGGLMQPAWRDVR